MLHSVTETRNAINWGSKGKRNKVIVLGLALALLAWLAGAGVVPGAQAALPMQPELLAAAEQNPDALVSVIVQKTARDDQVEQMVARLGGTVTHNLSIINAFAAEVPGRAVPALALNNGVRWVSLDAPVVRSGGPDGTVDTSKLLNVYNKAIGADKLWAEGYQGSSVTVAVVDSGIVDHEDFKMEYGGNGDQRIRTTALIVNNIDKYKDWYGHGTHVAGLIGGNGTKSERRYVGVAPKVKLVAVDVANEQGMATASDVVAGLQWVYNNRTPYNIRVVNLSLNGSVLESYHTNPLTAAAEILWINGIVVVVSAGNNGDAKLYPPANDPFVITVGAVDDRGTASTSDDILASFSAYGTTTDGFSKPDLVAPGKNLIGVLSKPDNYLRVAHPSNSVYTFSGSQDYYFKMSGTSMSAAVTTGAIALLLQDEPNLNPDQVKYRLRSTARAFNGGNKAPYLDIYAAVNGTSTATANTGLAISQMLFTGSSPANWGSANWGSANWGSANWGSANWGSANWGSANWGSDYWGN